MIDCCSAEASPRTVTPKRGAHKKTNCPHCGRPGQPVALQTLKHQVKPEYLETVDLGPYYFCRTARCDAVFFNQCGAVLIKADVRERIGLKETDDPVPLCYCFGFTAKMAIDEICATGTCTIPQRIAAEVKAGNCACEIRNPQGICCLGNVTTAVKKVIAERLLIANG